MTTNAIEVLMLEQILEIKGKVTFTITLDAGSWILMIEKLI